MSIWKKLREKFSSTKVDDSNDAQFSDTPLSDSDEEVVVEHDERLAWVLDNFGGWPSPSYEYVALIEQADPVVGTKRTLKFYKRPTKEGVVGYSREYIDNLLNSGE